MKGYFITAKKQNNQDRATRNMVATKTACNSCAAGMQNSQPKHDFFIQNTSRANIRKSSANFHPLVQEKTPKFHSARRLVNLGGRYKKLTQDQERLSLVKVYMFPFLKVSVLLQTGGCSQNARVAN